MSQNQKTQPAQPVDTALSRRRLFAGAGAAGAVAAVAAVLPASQPADTVVAAVLPESGMDKGGYQLTEHVEHYYRTARV